MLLMAMVMVAAIASSPVTAPPPAIPGVPTTRTVPVLMYHDIGTPPPTARYPDLWVRTAAFDAQMQYLADHGWHTVTAAELGAAMVADRPVPSRSIVITFDDGRPNSFTNAFPILEKYGMRATFFVPAGLIGVEQDRMSWDQLATLAEAGNEIANHTMTHASMIAVGTSTTRLTRQILDAGTRIQDELGARGVNVEVTTFCYPYGYVTNAAADFLSGLGVYSVAFTTAAGRVIIGRTSRMTAPRIRMHHGTTVGQLASSIGG